MNRRGWLKLLGLAPVVPIAAALPVFAEPAKPDLYKMIIDLDARLKAFDLAMMRAAARECDGWISEKAYGTLTMHASRFDPAGEVYLGGGRLMEFKPPRVLMRLPPVDVESA